MDIEKLELEKLSEIIISNTSLYNYAQIVNQTAQWNANVTFYNGLTANQTAIIANQSLCGDANLANQSTLLDICYRANVTANRAAGLKQYYYTEIEKPANSGNHTFAKAYGATVIVEDIIIEAVGAQTSDLVCLELSSGNASLISYFDATEGAQANLDVNGKQISWTGAQRISTTSWFTINLSGTGATNVDLYLDIGYRATSNNGYLYGDLP